MEATQEATPTVKRDPRTREELEKVFPGRLWVIARKAAEHGWDITVHPTQDGWGLFLTEDHHCIHLFWVPNLRSDADLHPWTMVRSSLAPRCPNGGRVHVRDLPGFLENHPDECLPTHTRRPIVELSMPDCTGHLPTAGRPARNPLAAPVIATVDVVDVAQHAIHMYGQDGARQMLPPGVPFLEHDYRFELAGRAGAVTTFPRGADAGHIAEDVARQAELKKEQGWIAGEPFNPGTGVVPGFVVGTCGHRVAQSEWAAGFQKCEHC
jgi:hypothetical protein